MSTPFLFGTDKVTSVVKVLVFCRHLILRQVQHTWLSTTGGNSIRWVPRVLIEYDEDPRVRVETRWSKFSVSPNGLLLVGPKSLRTWGVLFSSSSFLTPENVHLLLWSSLVLLVKLVRSLFTWRRQIETLCSWSLSLLRQSRHHRLKFRGESDLHTLDSLRPNTPYYKHERTNSFSWDWDRSNSGSPRVLTRAPLVSVTLTGVTRGEWTEETGTYVCLKRYSTLSPYSCLYPSVELSEYQSILPTKIQGQVFRFLIDLQTVCDLCPVLCPT